jgi:hypothetical protein
MCKRELDSLCQEYYESLCVPTRQLVGSDDEVNAVIDREGDLMEQLRHLIGRHRTNQLQERAYEVRRERIRRSGVELMGDGD